MAFGLARAERLARCRRAEIGKRHRSLQQLANHRDPIPNPGGARLALRQYRPMGRPQRLFQVQEQIRDLDQGYREPVQEAEHCFLGHEFNFRAKVA